MWWNRAVNLRRSHSASQPQRPSSLPPKLQYAREQMGSHFRFCDKEFCLKIPFVRIPICSRISCKEFRFPFSENAALWPPKLSRLTTFSPKSSHFDERLVIYPPKIPICSNSHLFAKKLQGVFSNSSHLFEFPFARERTVCHGRYCISIQYSGGAGTYR